MRTKKETTACLENVLQLDDRTVIRQSTPGFPHFQQMFQSFNSEPQFQSQQRLDNKIP